eukprot:10371948-Lingulodinium_polyedra.AAC.1
MHALAPASQCVACRSAGQPGHINALLDWTAAPGRQGAARQFFQCSNGCHRRGVELASPRAAPWRGDVDAFLNMIH